MSGGNEGKREGYPAGTMAASKSLFTYSPYSLPDAAPRIRKGVIAPPGMGSMTLKIVKKNLMKIKTAKLKNLHECNY